MLTFAYFTSATKNARDAKDFEDWKGLLFGGGPYHYRNWIFKGKKGVVATPFLWNDDKNGFKDDVMELSLLDQENSEQVAEKIWYIRPKVPNKIDDLAKADVPENINVSLNSGVTLSIPLAMNAPRNWSFRKKQWARTCTKFGELAYDLIEKAQHNPEKITDEELGELILRAIQECYRVTEDVLDDMNWVSSLDFMNIATAIGGVDPKSSGTPTAEEPSDSKCLDSEASRLPQEKQSA